MKQDSKPLWQRLNEERTQGDWSVNPISGKELRMLKTGVNGYNVRIGILADTEQHQKNEPQANARYTALAVNNLASLAEGYTKFMEDYLKGEESLDVICRRHFETAKEALNKIS